MRLDDRRELGPFEQSPPLSVRVAPSGQLDLAPVSALTRAVGRCLPLRHDPSRRSRLAAASSSSPFSKASTRRRHGTRDRASSRLSCRWRSSRSSEAKVAPVAVQQIEGIDHQLASPAPHAQMQPHEIRRSAGARQAQLSVDDRSPAGNAGELVDQAGQAPGPVVAGCRVAQCGLP